MRPILLSFIAFTITLCPVFAQVDTLELVEINSIEVAGEIREIYTESIRDSIQEIFICTDNHVYAFDSQTNEVIWSRGELYKPCDLLFQDINNDGFKDISFCDSLNIFIYDVINNDHIWTSPVLDSTYKCYTLGDRNFDGWADIITVAKEPFSRVDDTLNVDTAWINIYDGLQFQLNASGVLLMPNYYYTSPLGMSDTWYFNDPHQIYITYQENQCKLLMFTKVNYGYIVYQNYTVSGTIDGDCWYISNDLLIQNRIQGIGFISNNDLTSLPYSNHAFAITKMYSSYEGGGHGGFRKRFYSNRFSLDTLEAQDTLWHIFDQWMEPESPIYAPWFEDFVGEFYSDNSTLEICYGYMENIYLKTYPSLDHIWNISVTSDQRPIIGSLNTEFYNPIPQVITQFNNPELKFILYSGNNGDITAYIKELDDIGVPIISDLNADNNDELLSIDGNTLRIYTLEYATDINEPDHLPHQTYVKPNYPNPFNSSTTISYTLTHSSNVTLDIYNILGRKVETLYNGNQPAGSHSLIWNADGFSSGIYFYKLTAGEYKHTQKMMLLK